MYSIAPLPPPPSLPPSLSQLGWQPLVESYLNTLPDVISDENKKLIRDLFGWLVQPSIDFIRHNCRRFVTTSALHLVFSLMRLYSCLMDEIRASGTEDGAKMQQSQVCTRLSNMWSIRFFFNNTHVTSNIILHVTAAVTIINHNYEPMVVTLTAVLYKPMVAPLICMTAVLRIIIIVHVCVRCLPCIATYLLRRHQNGIFSYMY